MRALLDTCVLSEILRPQGAERVKLRIDAIADDDQYLVSMARDFEHRVMTRKVKDFAGTGAMLVNPWEDA